MVPLLAAGGAIVVIVLIVALSSGGGRPPTEPGTPAAGGSPATAGSPTAADKPGAGAPGPGGASSNPILPAVRGQTSASTPLSESWPAYGNTVSGLRLRYPPGWQALELPERGGVGLYPPGADPSTPAPAVFIQIALDAPFRADGPIPAYVTAPAPITVGGRQGRQFEDQALATPFTSRTVEVPHRGGTLTVTASTGPLVDLTPQMDEILKSIVLQP